MPGEIVAESRPEQVLAGELAQEFPLVHAVLKGLASVDEDHGNFVVVLAAEFKIAVDVYFPAR